MFVDESSTSIAMTRRRARSPRGKRAPGKIPRNHGQPTSLIASLGPQGLGEAMTVEGAVDSSAFNVYVRQLLCPSLQAGQIVVLDNLSVHKATAAREAIEGRGCQLLFLPPYSPDYSPIELAFAKIKECLRGAGARSQQALDEAISRAMALVTAADALAWFQHCGYANGTT